MNKRNLSQALRSRFERLNQRDVVAWRELLVIAKEIQRFRGK